MPKVIRNHVLVARGGREAVQVLPAFKVRNVINVRTSHEVKLACRLVVRIGSKHCIRDASRVKCALGIWRRIWRANDYARGQANRVPPPRVFPDQALHKTRAPWKATPAANKTTT